MKLALYIVLGLIPVTVFFRKVFIQLKHGHLMARGGHVYATRKKNSMLFWSTMFLETLAALLVLGVVILVVWGNNQRH